MGADADLAMILADIRREFIEGTFDRLDEVDRVIAALLDGRGDWNNNILEIKRNVHSIKGGGGTFGFPTVSMIAHALEDYLETASSVGQPEIRDAQVFIDRIRAILEEGENPDDDEATRILGSLPARRNRTGTLGTVLLLSPKGLQRKIIGQELNSFGFRVSIAETPLKALELALAHRPGLVVSTMVMDTISGLELAQMISVIKALEKTKILLVTASDIDGAEMGGLPPNATVIRKGMNFARDFLDFLKREGFTGRKN